MRMKRKIINVKLIYQQLITKKSSSALLALRKGINDAFKFHSIVIVIVHTCNDMVSLF